MNEDLTGTNRPKIKFSIKDHWMKSNQVWSFFWSVLRIGIQENTDQQKLCIWTLSTLRIWSHLLKKSLIEDFNLCAVPSQKVCKTELKVSGCQNFGDISSETAFPVSPITAHCRISYRNQSFDLQCK